MKKLIYILALFLALPFTSLAQKDSTIITEKKQPTFKNQLDLDVEFLGVSFGYKKRLHKNWFVGARIGGGVIFTEVYYDVPKNFKNISKTTLFEYSHGQLLLQYSIKNYIIVEIGPRLSILTSGVDNAFAAKVGLSNGLYVGIRKIQVGIRLMFLNLTVAGSIYSFYEESYSTSLLVVRIPLKKWK